MRCTRAIHLNILDMAPTFDTEFGDKDDPRRTKTQRLHRTCRRKGPFTTKNRNVPSSHACRAVVGWGAWAKLCNKMMVLKIRTRTLMFKFFCNFFKIFRTKLQKFTENLVSKIFSMITINSKYRKQFLKHFFTVLQITLRRNGFIP